MSLDVIQLPDFLLADLYKDCLVELDNFQTDDTAKSPITKSVKVEVPQPDEPSAIRYIGENKKQIAILVSDEDAAFLNDDDLQFLTNVLKACSFNLGDIAIINNNKQQVTYTKLASELNSKYVLLFDVQPATIQLPFSIPDFQPYPFAGCTYMKAPALHTINLGTAEGKTLKTSLWKNLQQIFQIK